MDRFFVDVTTDVIIINIVVIVIVLLIIIISTLFRIAATPLWCEVGFPPPKKKKKKKKNKAGWIYVWIADHNISSNP